MRYMNKLSTNTQDNKMDRASRIVKIKWYERKVILHGMKTR